MSQVFEGYDILRPTTNTTVEAISNAIANRIIISCFGTYVPLPGIRSDFHSGKTWALKGHTPIIETTGARFGLNMISAISTRGQLRFMIVEGSVKADSICEFLKRLMHLSDNTIFLIWDGHPTHKSKKVKKCIESFNGRLQVITLPSYSPELNPTKQVWNQVKIKGVSRNVIYGPDQLKAIVISQLRKLQKLSALICAFFKHPDCSYIFC